MTWTALSVVAAAAILLGVLARWAWNARKREGAASIVVEGEGARQKRMEKKSEERAKSNIDWITRGRR